MSGFDDMVSAHLRGIVTSPLHRGEQVTYVFKSGEERAIPAVVHREGGMQSAAGVQTKKRRAVVVIPFGATDGITEVTDGDRILLAIDKKGGEVVSCRIREVILQTGGSFHVEVQAP